jgi:hypothetical protein
MRLPRFRYTILSLMIVVLLASLVLTLIVVVPRERRRAIALQQALAEYENATLTREVDEIAVVEYIKARESGEMALAQSDAQREADRRAWAEKSQHPGLFMLPDAERQVDHRERARRAHIQEPTLRNLRADVERARSVEQAKKAEYDRLKAMGTGLFW